MADSISVLPPGWRALTTNGTPISDGILRFYLASTTTPLPVFSDYDLTDNLGAVIALNSAGYPTSDGNAKTLLYTGTAPYRVVLSSALNPEAGFDHPEVRGALDTSNFLTSAAVARKSVIESAVNRTITVNDIGKIINFNPTAGTLTATLPTAASVGAGFFVSIRHDGTANFVRIIVDGVETIGLNGAVVTQFALTGRGQVVSLVTNGTNWKVDNQVEPLISNNTGVILIADRLSTPPGSPTIGARYIVGPSPTGAWSTFTVGDIAEENGYGGWFRYTPPANSGWTAYVQDEGQHYIRGSSTWFAIGPTPHVSGLTITNNAATPTTQIDIDATDAFIGTKTGLVDLTLNAATTGANGIDTGALANNTWYYIFLISNGTTVASLLSLSATAPTLPSGYVYFMRVGAVRTLGAATFVRILQRGQKVVYRVVTGSVTPNYPSMITGASGDPNAPTYTSVAVANFVPPTAIGINGMIGISQSTGAFYATAAPNNNHGPATSGTNPAGCQVGSGGDAAAMRATFEFLLESTNIFYAANSGAGTFMACTGWIDAVNAT